MIKQEWPAIRADIDAGHPCPLGLVRLKSSDPFDLKRNHQVVASMSIQFFYEPPRFKSLDPEGKDETSYMVDGGMLSNFPIEVFDRTDGKPPRWPTFGIKLSAKPDAAQRVKNDVHGTFSLALAMLGTMTSFHDQIHIDDPATLARTMFVDTFGVRATEFGIDETRQDMLFKSGRRTAKKFLDGWDFERYVKEFRTDQEQEPVSSEAPAMT